ncbi:YcfA-like protein [Candidatus Promineifilum breve]|uniref:YcfA-like protein n=1 Tax=Candidatus Promineifilum breve TaxID=1806508 RepID=A0A160T4S0_9CHLR|nr:YcfA-like protein [Candidatus Promineifilum breve]
MWYYNFVTKRQKRLEKVRNNPKNVRFEELDQLLLEFGFKRRQPRSGSSHFIYIRGQLRLTIPMNRPHLREVYVKSVVKLLDEIENE